MSGELIVAEKDWLAVKGSVESLPMPFKHEVFLKECHVAGTLHVDDVLYKTKTVNVGTRLALKRDVGNERDPLAICVETQEGDRVGWIPQKYNDVLARLMDAGKRLFAKVSSKSLEDHWLNLRIEIYLEDF